MSVGLYAAIYFILNICRDAQYITLHDMSSFDSIGLYLFFRSLFFVYLFVYTLLQVSFLWWRHIIWEFSDMACTAMQ